MKKKLSLLGMFFFITFLTQLSPTFHASLIPTQLFFYLKIPNMEGALSGQADKE